METFLGIPRKRRYLYYSGGLSAAGVAHMGAGILSASELRGVSLCTQSKGTTGRRTAFIFSIVVHPPRPPHAFPDSMNDSTTSKGVLVTYDLFAVSFVGYGIER